MCELVALVIAARVLFALLVARCLQCDVVQGMHAVYRYPLLFYGAAASVALHILFALLVNNNIWHSHLLVYIMLIEF